MKTFESEVTWEQMKEMFKNISESGAELDRGHRIFAKELIEINLKHIRPPVDAKGIYSWMKNSVENGNKKLASMQITLRRNSYGGNCEWNVSMNIDEKFYCADSTLVDEPNKCRYHSNCGRLCTMLYKGFLNKDYDYENIASGAGRPENKGARDSKRD